MARIADAITLMFEGGDAKGVENAEKGVAFGREEAHFRLIARKCCRKGVLDHRGEGGITHDEAAFAPTVEAMREQAEGIGVAVEVSDVVPRGFGQHIAVLLSRALGEEGTNGLFARVTEGRIAHIVRQTGGRHFERVRQAVVDKNATRERKHLSLVLHAPKGRRKDEAIVVALEFGALFGGMLVAIFFAQTARRDEIVPIHRCKCSGFQKKAKYATALSAYFSVFLPSIV